MSEDILERAKAEYEIADDDIIDLLGELIAEVERLRSELTTANVRLMAAGEMVCTKDARIKELEAIRDEAFAIIEEKNRYEKRLEAAFLEAQYYMKFTEEEAREALERIRSGEKDE